MLRWARVSCSTVASARSASGQLASLPRARASVRAAPAAMSGGPGCSKKAQALAASGSGLARPSQRQQRSRLGELGGTQAAPVAAGLHRRRQRAQRHLGRSPRHSASRMAQASVIQALASSASSRRSACSARAAAASSCHGE
ncbi:MAG: hypothetical protein IPK42_18870 [Betaproteobacteria bacterium]|nr:hypothetical protein [Betaproteobacteria bacterium]